MTCRKGVMTSPQSVLVVSGLLREGEATALHNFDRRKSFAETARVAISRGFSGRLVCRSAACGLSMRADPGFPEEFGHPKLCKAVASPSRIVSARGRHRRPGQQLFQHRRVHRLDQVVVEAGLARPPAVLLLP